MFTCNKCEKEFKVGDWDCVAGGRHTVTPKEYYAAAANWRTYVSEERNVAMADGLNHRVPARQIEFCKGVYRTSDAEDQYALDRHKGLITVERWKEIHIPIEERLKMRERELTAREERIAHEENSLLARVKAAGKGHNPAA